MCVVVVREGERYEVSSQGFVVRGREGSTKNEFSPAGHQRRKGGREVERDCCCVGGFKEEEKKAHAIPAKVIQAHRRRRRRRRAFPAELEVAVRKPLAPMLEKRKQQRRRSQLTAPSAAAAATEEEEEEGPSPFWKHYRLQFLTRHLKRKLLIWLHLSTENRTRLPPKGAQKSEIH